MHTQTGTPQSHAIISADIKRVKFVVFLHIFGQVLTFMGKPPQRFPSYTIISKIFYLNISNLTCGYILSA